MPRKSAASLTVVPGSIDGRPKAPVDLTPAQTQIWDDVVATENAAQFKSAALQQCLKEYCRHVDSANKLTAMVQRIEDADEMTAQDLEALEKLLRMRERETRAQGDKATKLRLTNQSRYNARSAATAANRSGPETKPWSVAK